MTDPAPPVADAWGMRTLDGIERKNLWIVAIASAAAWPLFSAAAALNERSLARELHEDRPVRRAPRDGQARAG